MADSRRSGTRRADAPTRSASHMGSASHARTSGAQRRTAQPTSRTASARRSRAAQPASRGGATRFTNTAQSVSSRSNPRRRGAARRPNSSRRHGAPILALIAVVGVIATVLLFVLHPWKYDITVNGEKMTVRRNATIAKVLENDTVNPVPGNLLAVDGSLAKEGGGDAFAATVNGKATNDPETVLPKGAVVEITDGADTTESFQSTEETIPHGEHAWDTEMGSYWNGSLHVYMKGEDGLKVTKTGDVSGITVTEQTKDPVDAGYTIYTASVGEDKVVALTFDDGPWGDTTDQILNVLEQYSAKATFFTIGNQIADHADQVRRAHDLGCQICTHTWDHAEGSGQGVNLTYMSSEEQIAEVTKGYEAIKQVLGEEPSHVMRAPGGNYYGEMVSTLQSYVDAEVGWDVDTEDWRLPGSDAIYEAIMSVKPGQVILMHDGGGDRSQTVEAVTRAVPELVSEGYRLVTVDELLAYAPPSTDGTITVG